MAQPRELRSQLLDYALGLPEAYPDHPWGEDVAKVRKKVFVFFGMPEGSTYPVAMTVKPRESQALALAQPGATPTGYGLGKAGWVSIDFAEGIDVEMLRNWIDESYRAVAPKRLAAGVADRR